MTILSAPPFPKRSSSVANEHFVVRFETADARTHEVECRDGGLAAWRQARTEVSVPVLELYVPRVLDDEAASRLPFLEDPYLHRDVLVGSDGALNRLFPLAITGRQEAKEFLPEFTMLWILRDGPFGDFAWRNVFVDGRCALNDAVATAETENTPWDIIIEVDFTDCSDYFLGGLEFRELIARGQVEGSIHAISAVTWFVERDEMLDRAREHRSHADLLRDWVTIVRSDATRAWASQLHPGD